MEYLGWRAMSERPTCLPDGSADSCRPPRAKAARLLGAAVALPNGWRGESCRAWRSTETRRRRSCRDEAAGAPVEGGLEVFGAARLPAAPRGGGRGRPRRRRTVTAFSEPADR